MNFTRSPILILIVLILNLSVEAQEKWTLNQCIEYGIRHNLQMHNNELSQRIARQSFHQSKWNLLPSIGAGSDAGRNFGKSIDPNTNGMINTSFFNNSYYLSASMDLFRGFMLQNQIRYSNFKAESAANNRISAIDDLAFEIMNAFFDVIYYEEMLKIAEEQKSLSDLNLKKTKLMVSSGFKAQTELLDVMANLERDELAVIRTANEIESSRINLKRAMNLPAEVKITLSAPDDDPVETDKMIESPDELFKFFSGWSPKIRLYEYEWRASRKDIAMRAASWFPAIRLQAGYNTGYYETNRGYNDQVIAFSDQIRNNQREYISASLSIPVFSKNSIRSALRQSKMNSQMAENRLNQAKQDLFYEIEKNQNELNASRKELRQSERQVEADKLSFQAAQKKFDEGMINVVEFYVIKNQFANSTSQVLHSRLMLGIKKRTSAFYKGERFWVNNQELKSK